MISQLIPVTFDKIMQTASYTVVVLNARDTKFAIYTDPSIGKTLQLHLTGASKPRPLTHDLMSMIFHGLNIQVKQIVITDLQDTIYFARIFLEQEGDEGVNHIVEVDARPSDCITLALIHNAPVYCTPEVLEKTLPWEE